MGMDSVKKRKILENIKIQYCNVYEFGEKHKKPRVVGTGIAWKILFDF